MSTTEERARVADAIRKVGAGSALMVGALGEPATAQLVRLGTEVVAQLVMSLGVDQAEVTLRRLATNPLKPITQAMLDEHLEAIKHGG